MHHIPLAASSYIPLSATIAASLGAAACLAPFQRIERVTKIFIVTFTAATTYYITHRLQAPTRAEYAEKKAWNHYLKQHRDDRSAWAKGVLTTHASVPELALFQHIVACDPCLQQMSIPLLRKIACESERHAWTLVESHQAWKEIRASVDEVKDISNQYPQIALWLATSDRLADIQTRARRIDLFVAGEPALETAIVNDELGEPQVRQLLDITRHQPYVCSRECVATANTLYKSLQKHEGSSKLPKATCNQLANELLVVMALLHADGILGEKALKINLEKVDALASDVDLTHVPSDLRRLLEGNDTVAFAVGKAILENPDADLDLWGEKLEQAFETLQSVIPGNTYYCRAQRMCGDLLLCYSDATKDRISPYYKRAHDAGDPDAWRLYMATEYLVAEKEDEQGFIHSSHKETFELEGYSTRTLSPSEIAEGEEPTTLPSPE